MSVVPTQVTVPTVQQHVPEPATQLLVSPRPECLLCYVQRMLDQFDCDNTLRFAAGWRDQQVPSATALESRLQSRGGFCDCEIFLNGWTVAVEHCRADALTGEAEPPATMPGCLGVGARSSQPCSLWVPMR